MKKAPEWGAGAGLVVHVPLDVVIHLVANISHVALNAHEGIAGRAAAVGLELSLHSHLRLDDPRQAATDGYKNGHDDADHADDLCWFHKDSVEMSKRRAQGAL